MSEEDSADVIENIDWLQEESELETIDDIYVPSYIHHFTLQSDLKTLVKEGMISGKDADAIYKKSKKSE